MILEYNDNKGELRLSDEKIRGFSEWKPVCIGIDEQSSYLFFNHLNQKIHKVNNWSGLRPSYEDVMFEFALFYLTKLSKENPN